MDKCQRGPSNASLGSWSILYSLLFFPTRRTIHLSTSYQERPITECSRCRDTTDTFFLTASIASLSVACASHDTNHCIHLRPSLSSSKSHHLLGATPSPTCRASPCLDYSMITPRATSLQILSCWLLRTTIFARALAPQGMDAGTPQPRGIQATLLCGARPRKQMTRATAMRTHLVGSAHLGFGELLS